MEALNTSGIFMKCVKTHYIILNVSYLTTAAAAAAAAEVAAAAAKCVASRTHPYQLALHLNNNYLHLE